MNLHKNTKNYYINSPIEGNPMTSNMIMPLALFLTMFIFGIYLALMHLVLLLEILLCLSFEIENSN